MRQKCVRNASKWVLFYWERGPFQNALEMRQICVKNASKIRGTPLGESTFCTIPINSRKVLKITGPAIFRINSVIISARTVRGLLTIDRVLCQVRGVASNLVFRRQTLSIVGGRSILVRAEPRPSDPPQWTMFASRRQSFTSTLRLVQNPVNGRQPPWSAWPKLLVLQVICPFCAVLRPHAAN